MRSKEDIMKDAHNVRSETNINQSATAPLLELILEVLLDIRDNP